MVSGAIDIDHTSSRPTYSSVDSKKNQLTPIIQENPKPNIGVKRIFFN